jgi:hypothetical protein
MSITITRDEIADVCRAHDKFMIEAREWVRSPPVSETDDAGLVYKQHDNSEPAHAATREQQASEGDWSAWETWIAGHLANARAELLDTVTRAVGEVIGRERAATRQERDAELLKLKSEIAELRGKIDTLLSLMTKGGSVVDLPRGGWKRDGAA